MHIVILPHSRSDAGRRQKPLRWKIALPPCPLVGHRGAVADRAVTPMRVVPAAPARCAWCRRGTGSSGRSKRGLRTSAPCARWIPADGSHSGTAVPASGAGRARCRCRRAARTLRRWPRRDPGMLSQVTKNARMKRASCCRARPAGVSRRRCASTAARGPADPPRAPSPAPRRLP